MENDRVAKRVYVGEYAGIRSVGNPQKRWIDTVKDCLKKRGLDVRQATRMVHDRSVCWVLTRCHSYMKPLKVSSPSVAKPTI